MALVGWIVLVGHICVEAEAVHGGVRSAPVVASQIPQPDHSDGHAECVSTASWSVNRTPLSVPLAPEASVRLEASIASLLVVPEGFGALRLDEIPRAGSGPPLYLLHAAFLI